VYASGFSGINIINKHEKKKCERGEGRTKFREVWINRNKIRKGNIAYHKKRGFKNKDLSKRPGRGGKKKKPRGIFKRWSSSGGPQGTGLKTWGRGNG